MAFPWEALGTILACCGVILLICFAPHIILSLISVIIGFVVDIFKGIFGKGKKK